MKWTLNEHTINEICHKYLDAGDNKQIYLKTWIFLQGTNVMSQNTTELLKNKFTFNISYIAIKLELQYLGI